jgi:hypothetical protein
MNNSKTALVEKYIRDGYQPTQAERLAEFMTRPPEPPEPTPTLTEPPVLNGVPSAEHEYESDGKRGGRCVHCRKHRSAHEPPALEAAAKSNGQKQQRGKGKS